MYFYCVVSVLSTDWGKSTNYDCLAGKAGLLNTIFLLDLASHLNAG